MEKEKFILKKYFNEFIIVTFFYLLRITFKIKPVQITNVPISFLMLSLNPNQ